MQIYLVRHGQTDWNEEGKMQGHCDVPLNAVGLAQAEAVGRAFGKIPIDRIISSDLVRARQTAGAIAQSTGLPVAVDSRLRERSFGEWEGTDYRQLVARTIELAETAGVSFFDARPAGGESLSDLWKRTLPIVSDLGRSDERIAFVTHGGTCATLLAQLIQGSAPTVRSFRFSNASITAIERRPLECLYFILRYDDVSHLSRAAT